MALEGKSYGIEKKRRVLARPAGVITIKILKVVQVLQEADSFSKSPFWKMSKKWYKSKSRLLPAMSNVLD